MKRRLKPTPMLSVIFLQWILSWTRWHWLRFYTSGLLFLGQIPVLFWKFIVFFFVGWLCSTSKTQKQLMGLQSWRGLTFKLSQSLTCSSVSSLWNCACQLLCWNLICPLLLSLRAPFWMDHFWPEIWQQWNINDTWTCGFQSVQMDGFNAENKFLVWVPGQ